MEEIQIYNTLTNKKEKFIPTEENKVKMYACGPTTYNLIHLGNARPVVVFDTVRRYFEYIGYDVNFVQNFTDVDDKIINKANETGEEPLKLAQRYIDEYFKDTERINVKRATTHPKVSENISEIIDFIKGLIEKGFAYEVDGDVYYSIEKFEGYGKLSGRDIEDLMAGARVDVDQRKKAPGDFALWKGAKEGEPFWESPWGKGRPGWHIECSVMSKKYLGEEFDIHGGGQDLIFPHHENEIAQSEAYTGKPMARYWMHNGFIRINKEKMSKSLGNFFLLREILDKFDPMVIRFYLLETHYRSPLDFDDDKIEMTQKSLERIKNAYSQLSRVDAEETVADAKDEKVVAAKDAMIVKFKNAMNDDFNTALAIASIFDFTKEVNIYLKEESQNKETIEKLKKGFDEVLGVLGMKFEEEARENDISSDLMELILKLRKEAKKNKNFDLADQIRDELKEIGIAIEDTRQGTTWKRS